MTAKLTIQLSKMTPGTGVKVIAQRPASGGHGMHIAGQINLANATEMIFEAPTKAAWENGTIILE